MWQWDCQSILQRHPFYWEFSKPTLFIHFAQLWSWLSLDIIHLHDPSSQNCLSRRQSLKAQRILIYSFTVSNPTVFISTPPFLPRHLLFWKFSEPHLWITFWWFFEFSRLTLSKACRAYSTNLYMEWFEQWALMLGPFPLSLWTCFVSSRRTKLKPLPSTWIVNCTKCSLCEIKDNPKSFCSLKSSLPACLQWKVIPVLIHTKSRA